MDGDATAGTAARLVGREIAVLVESDYYEPEIAYYRWRFAEEGARVRLVSRLWGRESLTFLGHEHRAPLEVHEDLADLTDDALDRLAAVIVPAGMVADRLRYTEDVDSLPPATEVMLRAFDRPALLKGVICHGMWLMAPIPHVVRGRRAVVHNNLLGDLRNMGGRYVDRDVVVDGDLVTGRTGDHCHLFARRIVDLLAGGTGSTNQEGT
ncbi:DJ-1/PfpI family protein [Actinosynnema sp. CS-041913]|uniref:DJ-1/PfpI family protein n=1 Tax=Actinosynnema sp. CS-041913 TaxID=3239917 RepID=UPI003D8D0E20